MIKAVLLDVDDTLLDFSASARASMEAAFGEFHLPYDSRVYPTFRRVSDALWLDLEKGLLTRSELLQIRWTNVFRELGIEADGAAFEQEFLRGVRKYIFPVEGALELVQYLAPRYTLCIASNSELEHQVERLTRCGIYPYIQKMFVSEELGAPKPEPQFFDRCIEALSPLSRDEILLIGDSLTADIRGGIQAGIHTGWFNRRGDTPSELPAVDFTVRHLSEVRNYL